MSHRNLVLIGFMGTGKSTVGRLCAGRLGLAFRDSDALIEARAGCSIAHLFTIQGEPAFRQLEREVIAELAATPGLVIATGGGAVLDPENAARLRSNGVVILLTAAPETILQRVGRGRTRPLLTESADPRARVDGLLAEREDRYRQAAHCQVDTTGHSVKEVVEKVLAIYRATV